MTVIVLVVTISSSFSNVTDPLNSFKAGNEVFIVWAYHNSMEAEDSSTFQIHSERGVSDKKMDLTLNQTGGVSLATLSLGVIVMNLLIALRCVL